MTRPAELPALAALGGDLLATTPRQRVLAFLRPALCIAAFAALARGNQWALLPLAVFLLFVSIVTLAHDLVHDALGLGRLATDVGLFLAGAVLLESGHAYRISHLRHHAVFPGPDDPEGDPARMSLLAAVAHGPCFLPRLWRWAWRRASRRDRGWLLAEALPVALALGAAVAVDSLALRLYVVLVVVGSWVYPLLTVHLPHHGYGDTPLTQTRTLRGRIVPALFLELTYHLEHHLYPAVPSHRLGSLARRLDPWLAQNGVRPVRVP